MFKGRVLFLVDGSAEAMEFFPAFLGEQGFETVVKTAEPICLSEKDGCHPDLIVCLGFGNPQDWFWEFLQSIQNIPVLYVCSSPARNLPRHLSRLEMPVSPDTFGRKVFELLPKEEIALA